MPLIGITTYRKKTSGNFSLPFGYVEAVRQAGGVPMLLPPGETQLQKILETVDGLIFAGGGDIAPSCYGGKDHPSVSRVDRVRDDFELALAEKVMTQNITVLGICRGFQLLSIATGGDLITHIPDTYDDTVVHRSPKGKAVLHDVDVDSQSRLAGITGTNPIAVQSMHHQAVNTFSKEWAVSARAADGIVEAIEHRDHPWIMAVLWHPELALNDPNQQKIFKAFIRAAGSEILTG